MAAPGRITGPDFIVKSVVETGEPARYTAGTALVFLLCFGGSLVVFSGVARDLRRSRAARAVEDAHAFDDNLSSLGHMYDKSYAFATECAGPALLPSPNTTRLHTTRSHILLDESHGPHGTSPHTTLSSAFLDVLDALNL